MKILFWASSLLVLYVYAGYPLLLAIWSSIVRRPIAKRPSDQPPTISIVIAARNEADRLPARLTNLLGLDYAIRPEIIVVSDGSTDRTVDAVARFGDRVRLIELPRGGKPLALNTGVAAAGGDIIVFADARQRFAPDALNQLIANFMDPSVGAVTGELVLDCEQEPQTTDSKVAESIGLYWAHEKWLRRQESRIWSTLGATGAIYAMRRALWRPLPPETILDDVLSVMRIVLEGKRVVFDDEARAFDRVALSGVDESRRKTRTLAGNYQILVLEPRLVVPFVNPVWVQYMSHKVGRLIVPWCLALALASNIPLAFSTWPYRLALMVQLCFYGLAFLGARSAHERSSQQMEEPLAVSRQRPAALPDRRLSL